jgi:hypothetical protein
VKPNFDNAFKDLSAPRLYGAPDFERKRVDDLDTTCPADRCRDPVAIRREHRSRSKSLA